MDIGGGGGAGKEVDQVAGGSEQPQQRMKIGWPTEVRHVAHVTFDRFHGFRGVPAELQPEPALAKAPSARYACTFSLSPFHQRLLLRV
jgi:hypothetical protein